VEGWWWSFVCPYIYMCMQDLVAGFIFGRPRTRTVLEVVGFEQRTVTYAIQGVFALELIWCGINRLGSGGSYICKEVKGRQVA
jgi:hypothetical protein